MIILREIYKSVRYLILFYINMKIIDIFFVMLWIIKIYYKLIKDNNIKSEDTFINFNNISIILLQLIING